MDIYQSEFDDSGSKKFQISIILPTLNAAKTIKECLESITKQEYPHYELLILDAGSTDGTLTIANDYAGLSNNIQIVSGRDSGIYDAMNKGIEKAKGEWLYFMGSDDTFINNEVLSAVAKHLSGDADIVYGNAILVPENIIESGQWNKPMLLNMCINHQRIFYKAGLFSNYGLFNTRYSVAADYDLNIRFFTNPAIITKWIDLPIACYHSGGFSASKIDAPFWNDFKTVMVNRFAPYLSKKDIYGRLAFYCWYKMQQKEYAAAFKLFTTIAYYTKNLSFINHSLSQLIKSLKN